jgi:tetratricopeptide (TPR) repeat protein
VGLLEALSLEDILNQAERLEKEYDWVGAVELYEKALNLVPQDDVLRMGEIHEQLSHAFYRAAMRGETASEFRERIQRAVEACERAGGFYEKSTGEKKSGWIFRCRALSKYYGYWLTSNPSEKRALLDECLELEERALTFFTESGNMLEYVKTYNGLPLVFFLRATSEWNMQVAKSIVDRGLKWGEKAVAATSELDSLYETAGANLTLAICLWLNKFLPEVEEIENNRLKGVKHLTKAVDVSEKVGDAYLSGFSHLWLGIDSGGEEAEKHFAQVLESGKRTRDNFLIGTGSDMLAVSTYWKGMATEDPEIRRQLAEKAMQFYDKGQQHCSIISFMSPRSGVIAPPGGYVEYYFHLASWETDRDKRLELLEKSRKTGMEALELAEDSDIPAVVAYVLHVVSKSLEFRAWVERDVVEKRSLLEKALEYREKTVEMAEKIAPFDYWDYGVMLNYLAEIKAILAEMETNPEMKTRLLEEAVLSQQKCIDFCNKVMPYYEKMGETTLFSALRAYENMYAWLLISLYGLTNKPDHLRKAIEVSRKAVESASKLDLFSRMAESNWRIARAQDMLGKHLEAAEDFKHASDNYVKAAEKLPQLKDLYQEYALYMQAWIEIEKARYHHDRQEYGSAKEHFEKASELHESLKHWGYLGPNYSAWAQVENAEELSRKEEGEEAIKAFEQASKRFGESKRSLQTQLSVIEDIDEKQMVTSMIEASDLRREYCEARVAIEEAKILDKKGDHFASSGKYGLAAEAFENISVALTSDQERREFKLLITLSRAWQKMTLAESEASPGLYAEASQLFEEAKDFSQNDKTKMLMLGHSRFCKALEAGTKFADTRDANMHTGATKYLESAASYYVKAGFPKASEYAEATELLLDAYAHMDNAKEEKDHEKKAKLYTMAETVLQTSAGSFMRAEHPEKREQVLGLLEKVKKERELALSLAEVLHAPAVVSATTSFTTPAPTREEAVGSERFEQADIQANLIVRQRELNVGENLDVEIELVNAGKGPALLIKVTEVIPKGFEIVEKPEMYRVEDSYVNMKGRRLDPLKTEELRLVLRPRVQGAFDLKPTVLYLDENGKYKSHKPEPINITVKELGVKGWLKGER